MHYNRKRLIELPSSIMIVLIGVDGDLLFMALKKAPITSLDSESAMHHPTGCPACGFV